MKDKTAEEIESSGEMLEALIEHYIKDEDRKNAIYGMLSGDFITSFLTAPASSKDEYHNSYIGGLFDHTLGVMLKLQGLNQKMELGFSEESVFIVSLLHDIGKAMSADLSGPYYIPSEEWKARKGQRFEVVLDPYFTTRDRTLFLLQHFGIKLTWEEYQAIMLNDGYTLEGNRSYAMKESPLAFWLSVADSWAAREEKQAKEPEKS